MHTEADVNRRWQICLLGATFKRPLLPLRSPGAHHRSSWRNRGPQGCRGGLRNGLGHVSVEKSPAAARVVEHHFPGCTFVESVQEVDHEMVKQASLVVIGVGPPCQGVSGSNNAGR